MIIITLELHPDTSKYSGLMVDGRTYEYRRLPFGTKVSGSVFNRIVRPVVLKGIDDYNVRVYIDDVKVQTTDFDTHLALLERIVSNVLQSGMTFSLEKTGGHG